MRELRELLVKHTLIDDDTGCWNWQRSRSPKGYGWQRWEGRMMLAHRLSYMAHKGAIPTGLHVLHSCDNPACVNPEHLRVGAHRENMRDKVERGRVAAGEDSGRAKLTRAEVREIREQYAKGGKTYHSLALEYNVSFALVGQIINNTIWKE